MYLECGGDVQMRRKKTVGAGIKYLCNDGRAMTLRAVVWREGADQKLMYF